MPVEILAQLRVRGGVEAIEFYQRAFGAVEIMRLQEDGGRIGYAELEVGEARFMLSDEYPEYQAVSPAQLGGTSVALSLQVDDADAVFERAVAAGATVRFPVQDQFYGHRSGSVIDPFGHQWTISTEKEKVEPDEMQRRFKALYD